MRKRPLLLCACVFVPGLLYGKALEWYYPVAVIGLAIYATWPLWKANMFWRARIRLIWIVVAFFVGIFHIKARLAFQMQEFAQIHEGTEISLCGEIYKKEIKKDQYWIYLKDCIAVSDKKQIPCNRVLLYQEADEYSIGDILIVNGKVNMFNRPSNEGMFDSRLYYHSQMIDFCMKKAKVQCIKECRHMLKEHLYQLRKRTVELYVSTTDAITAGVLSVMILGEKASLDADIKSLYQSMGISHILAISGLHVSLIGMGLYRFLRKRGLRYMCASAISVPVLLLYSTMTGNSVSTVRAVGMMVFVMIADYLGKGYDSLNALGGMCIWLLWENPYLLDYAGFILSVAAVIGVTTVGTAIQVEKPDEDRKKRKSSKKQKMLNALYAGVGIWLFTLPLIAKYYYEIPVYSVFLNLMVLPLLKYLLLLGLLGGGIGNLGEMMVADGAGWNVMSFMEIILFPCKWILGLYELGANVCLRLPKSQLITGEPSNARMIGFYLILFGFAVIWNMKKDKHMPRILGIIIAFVFLIIPTPKHFELDVLDVGQGDGIYICTEEGSSLFIDGGSSNIGGVGKYRILPFLKKKRVTHITYWFISHADTDHISGLEEVLESGYQVDYLVFAAAGQSDEAMSRLASLAEAYGTKCIPMKTGDKLRFKETCITCLAPENFGDSQDRNELCLVLKYEDSDFSGIFAGDISGEVEQDLINKYSGSPILDVKFYKVNHHGSKYSNIREWVEALSPEISVISCSSTNRYGHPSEVVISNLKKCGSEIYYTMEVGQICVRKSKTGLTADGYLKDD